ncbi:MAG: cupin domain-containing protein [Devosia sp.]
MIGNMSGITFEYFPDDGQFPNSPLPVVIYRAAVSADEASAEAMEALFDGNGWPSQWRAGVYDYHHYHSTAHECLGIASGSATLRLGGPGGRSFAVEAGDVLLLPAGTAHRCEGTDQDFLVVGAYPPGQNWDVLRGDAADRPEADIRIARVPLPVTDPVGGQGGPVLDKWR